MRIGMRHEARGNSKKAKYLVTFCVLFTLCVSASAQQPKKVPRIGYLSAASAENDKPLLSAFVHGLRDLGYIEGKNIIIEQRYASGEYDKLPELVSDLLRYKVDILVIYGQAAVDVARKMTGSLPIVMANVADPVGTGLVASLARPGGNITGLSDYHFATVTKRLELLKEVVPASSRIAVLLNSVNPHNLNQLKDLITAAPALGVKLIAVEIKSREEIDRALSTIRKESPGALLMIGDALLTAYQRRIAHFALEARLPAGYTLRQFAEAGGLMSYGTSFTEMWRRAAFYVDKILKGAKPADLPIEQPTKFEFVINLKTAKEIGLTIPPHVLARADRVIR
jgi:putative tryptophan/tyrosine transport system substrate-binding protein